MQNILTGKNALVVGNSGNERDKLIDLLLSFGAKIYCFSLPVDNEKNIQGVISLLGDVKNKNSLEIALKAAAPYVIFCFLDNKSNFETTVMGTLNLAELSKNLENLSKIIIFSDNSYGNENDMCEASKKAAVIAAKTYEYVLKENGITLLFKDFSEIDEILAFIESTEKV